MPALARLASMALRFGELIFACVIAGIIGSYLHDYDTNNIFPYKRFIYAEVIAGVSILLSLIWLLPLTSGFMHWPVDLTLFAAWLATFGLLVDFAHNVGCGGGVFKWGGITHSGFCNQWKAIEAFSFLSMIFWLVSAVLGLWFMHHARRSVATDGAGPRGRRWFGRSQV